MKYRVFGTASVIVSKVVEADSEREAIEKAGNTFGGLTSYSVWGSEDTNSLVGVHSYDGETVEPNDFVETIFDEARLVEEAEGF